MTTFVCLMRGVNVTGHAKLPMAELRESLTAAGLSGVKTYIQSGNVVFRSRLTVKTLKARLAALLQSDFQLSPDVLLFPAERLDRAIERCPYAEEAGADPRRVHLHFLGGRPAPGALEAAAALAGPDRFERVGDVIYLHTPGGYGKSKLAELLSSRKKLGVTVTARNFRSVLAVQSLAAEGG